MAIWGGCCKLRHRGTRGCGTGPAIYRGMNTGFYNAAIQMATSSVQNLEVHTENIANATMPGYKRMETSQTSFSEVMLEQVEQHKPESEIVVNHSQGALRSTERPLDFAIEGEGYFVVSDGSKQYLTRNGSFHLASDGTVVNSLGMALQTESGDLQIPAGQHVSGLEIDDQMNVLVGNRSAGQIKLISVANPSALEQAGSTLFVNSAGQPENTPEESTVLKGFLEQSNTGIFEEMVGIMTTMRNYEACQKMLKSVGSAEEKMMQKLG